ncbi:MAG: hypothetical protein AAF740_01585 [Bacteroidota bacterium]
MIVAPHEIDENTLSQIEKRLKLSSVRYSRLSSTDSPILILDTIGMLSSVYRYAAISYVGGAFGKGLHNTMEAAVYGVPVLFGNRKYKKFREAVELVERGGGITVGDANELLSEVRRLVEHDDQRERAGEAAAEYVLGNRGATQKIIQSLKNIFTTTA